MATKYIFVTGGVVSSLGKGITAASLGMLLKSRGLKVFIQKCDPYINIDPGTMSPYQHGEVFVTDDGVETDLDIGHYERFTDENSSKDSNVTTGKIYWSVLTKERRGDYLGATVQVIPHITNEIKQSIFKVANTLKPDIIISEVGGTVGDIESQPFLEALRQIKWDVGADNCMYIHVTLIPYLGKIGETKTKPTQHSVKELRAIGIDPDILVCRSQVPINDELKSKISLFCNVSTDCVIQNLDADSIYEVPLMLRKERLDEMVCRRLKLVTREPKLQEWEEIVKKEKELKGKITIGLVGKYVQLHDAYISIVESLRHAGIYNGTEVSVKWINAEDLEKENDASKFLNDVDGIIVPGGFGERGIEGKIMAVKYARENKVPYLGLCLGMQMSVIEFARNVLGLADANSTEFSKDTKNPVIDLMSDQKELQDKGGTMRLGSYSCRLVKGSSASAAYGTEEIKERHRHRYEFNNSYREAMEKAGMKIAGINPLRNLVEIVEIEDHPFFVAVQFHPEFKSRPIKPQPLFREFVAAAIKYKNK